MIAFMFYIIYTAAFSASLITIYTEVAGRGRELLGLPQLGFMPESMFAVELYHKELLVRV